MHWLGQGWLIREEFHTPDQIIVRRSRKTLKENEVYTFKKPTVIGGEYDIDNIEPTDMSIHFAFTGQINEQIKDLPDGTKVNIKYKP